ncbi:MAG: radical SAM protein [Methanopyri archaeon]|nr:radical SAM protein [Methanopyri archaeon]
MSEVPMVTGLRSRMDLRMGFACNNNCRFCVVGDEKRRTRDMATADVKASIDAAKEGGVTTLVFTGGEPTIRKDLVELVAHAGGLGFRDIILISNGRMLSYSDYLRDLVRAGLTTVSMSLPSHRPKLYEHLTRSQGGWQQLMQAFDNVAEHPLTVCTITCITKPAVGDLPDTTRFLIKQQERFHRYFGELIFVHPAGNARAYWRDIVPRMSTASPLVHAALDIAEEADILLNVEAIPLCHMQGYESHVIELTMAPEWEMREPGISGLDQNQARRERNKHKEPSCCSCRYDAVCEGPWAGYVDLFGFEEFRPVPGEPVTDPATLLAVAPVGGA